MAELLCGFEEATITALAEMGAPPAVWLRTGEVVVGELDGATEVLNLTDLTRLRFTPQPPGPNADWTLLARARDAAREMFRRSLDRKTNHTPVNSWVTAESRLNLILYRLYGVLTGRGIDSVAFNNIPHEPPLIVLYHLARAMGLRTLMTNQSPFADRFFAFETIEDYGRFVTSRAGPHPSVSLPEAPSRPFYMRKISSYDGLRHHLKNLGNAVEVALRFSSLPLGGDSYKFSKAYYKVVYFSRSRTFRKRYYTAEADFKNSYIYVPLHLQPELTIDVLGGAYGDQARAIEELSAALPPGWLIYVKENPKQTAVAREAPFFQRLEALSNVRLIRQETDTFELIRHARAVATWSGTAGWEALLMGKPAIVFGLAWYRCLPGVVEWRHGVDFDTLAEAGPDRETLRRAFAGLTRHMKKGVVDPKYAVIAEDFNREHNGRCVAKALLDTM